jgi:hypothetical protein
MGNPRIKLEFVFVSVFEVFPTIICAPQRHSPGENVENLEMRTSLPIGWKKKYEWA